MREIANELREWIAEGRRFAVASVVATGGSAPRPAGAALAVSAEGAVVGSVSGGCVEGAVYELCLQSLEELRPRRQSFGYSDDEAFAVGLTCGGTIEVLVWPFIPARQGSPAAEDLAALDEHLDSLLRGTPTILVRTLDGPPRTLAVRPDRVRGTLWAPPAVPGNEREHQALPAGSGEQVVAGAVDEVVTRRVMVGAAGEVAQEVMAGVVDEVMVGVVEEVRAMVGVGVREICRDGVRFEVFAEAYAPPPRMIVFGAIDFAGALTRVGRFLGYHVTVCDARPVFATRRRFPEADEVVVEWPHRYLGRTEVDARTVIAVLTHDAKFDVPVLEVALRLDVAYVGAMGSRRTHDDRLRRLREAGLTDRELARLRSPIGLDLGARTPEETALSIAAEFVALQRGGTGLPLTTLSGPIHHAA
ncbi:XdhC family protein [Nonomuraea sp. NPDC050536]|uniref:XdhC family protein n=1 Tax=Nonomuraea sp. NPDC050536 TaxID=3364366 RepID=UPI0037C56982